MGLAQVWHRFGAGRSEVVTDILRCGAMDGACREMDAACRATEAARGSTQGKVHVRSI